MTATLQDAISELMADAKERDAVVNVADAAVRLAVEYGGDPQEFAAQITQAGIHARINMKMDTPDAGRHRRSRPRWRRR